MGAPFLSCAGTLESEDGAQRRREAAVTDRARGNGGHGSWWYPWAAAEHVYDCVSSSFTYEM